MSNRSSVPVTTLSLSSSASSSSHNPLPDVGTRDYTILKEVGDGSFGTVWLADWHSPLTLPPGTQPPGPSSRPEYKGKQLVAVKKMKKTFDGGWEECMKLKELKVSIPLSTH
ncbi:male germ cell-associated kinase [Puccinia graminis f. sp. tritici CRL 75-36-700-3]|uniref:Male germ cell-associated kinase n=1 Tax=Puccinia graminis f. sp. tritici (strain CRL 75-36-700-3 / race SCCL) TaxID=418459 RepID=E3K077_PUCGT|nr:male germ cell-associated kinase [Puccinia graminis f. sp. tritici CRL 75-36-700-3]EFP77702.2 male germ cell-associated kinase [Puccinia graminis f. sp. tritici CRL 75-36-700-3]